MPRHCRQPCCCSWLTTYTINLHVDQMCLRPAFEIQSQRPYVCPLGHRVQECPLNRQELGPELITIAFSARVFIFILGCGPTLRGLCLDRRLFITYFCFSATGGTTGCLLRFPRVKSPGGLGLALALGRDGLPGFQNCLAMRRGFQASSAVALCTKSCARVGVALGPVRVVQTVCRNGQLLSAGTRWSGAN